MPRLVILLLSAVLVLAAPHSTRAQQTPPDSVVVDTSNVTVPVRVRVTTNAPTAAPPPATPAAVEPTPPEDPPPLRGSRKALSFTFDTFALDALDGGVGGKYWFNSSVALRAAMRFNVEATERDVGSVESSGRSAIGFGFSLLAERHNPELVSIQRVSPYLVGGMRFDVSGFSESTEFPLDNAVQEIENDGMQLSFAALAGFGVEYRFARRVSLAGEHVFEAAIVRTSSDRLERRRDTPNVERDVDQRVFRLGTGTSSLIVSVYF